MNARRLIPQIAPHVAALGVALGVCLTAAQADDLRKVNKGEPVPVIKLPTIDGSQFDSEAAKGKVLVVVYLSAEQNSSELAAVESTEVARELGSDNVELVHVTADVVHKPYYERLRAEKGIDCPLAFDASRKLYADLGLIVFPTTIIENRDGTLAHVISTRGPDYRHLLEVYVRHAMGLLSDEQLQEQLKARPSDMHSPKSLASRHRAAARLLRDKGLTDAAREELAQAQKLDPEDVEIRLDMADLDLATGNTDEAAELINGVLAEQPEHRRAKMLDGILLFQQGQLDSAESILVEALVLNPDPARVHYYLGQIYEKKGNTAKALEHYREALARLLHENR